MWFHQSLPGHAGRPAGHRGHNVVESEVQIDCGLRHFVSDCRSGVRLLIEHRRGDLGVGDQR
jgi:hypothetical protein